MSTLVSDRRPELSARDLRAMSGRELMAALCGGHPIHPDDLDDIEYKGTSLNLPRFVERLSWTTFKKVFHRDPATGNLRGWNVRIDQGMPEAYMPIMKNGRPVTFGHYRVVPLDGYRMPAPLHRGLMLDYGLGGNAPWDFISRVRDPIVAVNPGSTALLLGWSYLDLGALRMKTPSFFSLERDAALTHHADPRS